MITNIGPLFVTTKHFYPTAQKKIKKTVLRLNFGAEIPQREHNSGLAALKRPPSRYPFKCKMYSRTQSHIFHKCFIRL